jgi:hypothetical protein
MFLIYTCDEFKIPDLVIRFYRNQTQAKKFRTATIFLPNF